MRLEAFAVKWFIVYYATLGLLMLFAGSWLLIAPKKPKAYLIAKSDIEEPPPLLLNILKYWLLFTLPCLLFSFIPFSWPELLFSLWSLLILYIAGSQLVRWSHLRILIEKEESSLLSLIRWLGVGMLSAAVVIVLLEYVLIQRIQLI